MVEGIEGRGGVSENGGVSGGGCEETTVRGELDGGESSFMVR